MGKKVIAAGHICLDITPIFPERKAGSLGEILSPGKLIRMGEADVHTGGAVANTGLAMKILGADVTLMGKIGRDAFGDMVCGILKKYGVESGMIRSGTESTSYSVVLAVPGIDRIFLHHPGANDSFRASDIPQEALSEAALFHFGYPPLMRSMYEKDGEELAALFRKAKEAGAAASLDLAAVDPESEAGWADWEKILSKVMPYVDFFVPSAEELIYMLDRHKFEELQERAAGRDITEVLDVERDIRPIADRCMSYGAKILLIKCGKPGMYLRTADAEALSRISPKAGIDAHGWEKTEIFEKSYVPERVLSGTGAGDTSIAAFLTAALNGETPQDCMHLAAATGAGCVAAYDALGGLKPFEELKEKIAAGWQKIGEG